MPGNNLLLTDLCLVEKVMSDLPTSSEASGRDPGSDQFHEPDPIIELYKRDVDRSLIRENLKLTVEERFQKLMNLQKFATELRRAGRQPQKDD